MLVCVYGTRYVSVDTEYIFTFCWGFFFREEVLTYLNISDTITIPRDIESGKRTLYNVNVAMNSNRFGFRSSEGFK